MKARALPFFILFIFATICISASWLILNNAEFARTIVNTGMPIP